MTEESKTACLSLPECLYGKGRENAERTGCNFSQYITLLIKRDAEELASLLKKPQTSEENETPFSLDS